MPDEMDDQEGLVRGDRDPSVDLDSLMDIGEEGEDDAEIDDGYEDEDPDAGDYEDFDEDDDSLDEDFDDLDEDDLADLDDEDGDEDEE